MAEPAPEDPGGGAEATRSPVLQAGGTMCMLGAPVCFLLLYTVPPPRAAGPESSTRHPDAFSFKNHIHREHTTWVLTITPHRLRSAGALSAGLQALVIQVLHVPDTPRPVRSRVRHAHARPTFGQ